jgi:hypothetical protein
MVRSGESGVVVWVVIVSASIGLDGANYDDGRLQIGCNSVAPIATFLQLAVDR